ncbi:hypothetical protein ABPG77_002000 [Micractinium sp. CCAP 211/92]
MHFSVPRLLFLSLSSFFCCRSIEEFAQRFRDRGSKLTCLMNNAGVQIPKGPEKTSEGFEIHVGTNFLGHFLLTHLLLDVLRENAPARIVFMSSPQGARSPGIPWDDLAEGSSPRGGEFVRPGESSMDLYGTANLCKLMVAKEMAQRLEGSGVDVFVVQPGTTQSDLFPKQDYEKSESKMLDTLQKYAGQSPERGALSTLYCATEPELQGKPGGYYGPWYSSSGMAVNVGNTAELEPTSKEAQDPEARAKLYELAAKAVTSALGRPLPNKLPRSDEQGGGARVPA